MRRILKTSLYLTLGAFMAANIVACDDSNSNEWNTEKEDALKVAIYPYVDNTVVATYKQMADASIILSTKCDAMKDAFSAGTLTTDLVKEAGMAWNNARKYWELSEAFLYGAAHDYNIDPHIDSWPLDKVAMEAMLNNKTQMALIEEKGADYILSASGY